MDESRKFQGKEIEQLLAAAARLQQRETADSEEHDTGLTLAEIEEIARDSGIDPQFVRMAAVVQADDRESEDKFYFFGGPATIKRTVTLNRSLTRSEMEELVPTFRRILENEGSADSLEKSLSWRTNNRRNQGGTSVTMQAIDGSTVCNLKASVWMPGFLIHYIPLILSLMVVSGIGGFDAAGFGLKLAILSMVFLATRVGYSYFYKKKRQELDDVERAIRESIRADTSDGVGQAESDRSEVAESRAIESEKPKTERSDDSAAGDRQQDGRINLDDPEDEGDEPDQESGRRTKA